MTATDELRRLLDERGVEWRKAPHYSSESQDNETIFEGNGIEWYTNDHMNGRLGLRTLRYEVTPEQAVEATLGRGTCRMTRVEDEERILYGWMECSECGPVYPPAAERIQDAVKFCPFCGRKVVNA